MVFIYLFIFFGGGQYDSRLFYIYTIPKKPFWEGVIAESSFPPWLSNLRSFGQFFLLNTSLGQMRHFFVSVMFWPAIRSGQFQFCVAVSFLQLINPPVLKWQFSEESATHNIQHEDLIQRKDQTIIKPKSVMFFSFNIYKTLCCFFFLTPIKSCVVFQFIVITSCHINCSIIYINGLLQHNQK